MATPTLLKEQEGPNSFVEYQSLGFLPGYRNFSPEELRLQDYEAGRVPAALKPLTNSTSGPQNSGYARAGSLVGFVHTAFHSPGVREPAGKATRLGDGMLMFYVGEQKTRFAIHEGAVATRSEFVRLALRHDWKEAQERCISLPEDDAPSFDIYQLWLYSGSLFTYPDITSQRDDEYGVLVRAYLLGQKLMDNDFKDTVIDAIAHKLTTSGAFDIKQTSAVYDNTPKSAPLRRLWLDIYRSQGQEWWLAGELDECDISAEFLLELSRSSLGRTTLFQPSPAYIRDLCQYHEHTDGVCYKAHTLSARIPAFRTPAVPQPRHVGNVFLKAP